MGEGFDFSKDLQIKRNKSSCQSDACVSWSFETIKSYNLVNMLPLLFLKQKLQSYNWSIISIIVSKTKVTKKPSR